MNSKMSMNLNNFTSTTSLNLNDLPEKWMLNYPTILVKCKNTVVTWIIVSLQFSLVQLVRYKRALRRRPRCANVFTH